MQHSTGKATSEHLERWRIAAEIGCVPCILDGRMGEPPDMQHIIVGNKRVGHEASYGCCAWHHRGVPKDGMSATQMEAVFGPSLARGSKPYHRRYGSEFELLAIQNALIEKHRALTRGYEGG